MSSESSKTCEHGCIVTAKWGWSNSESTGRWSTPQQAYKRQRVHISDNSNEYCDDGFDVAVTKLKVRGKGVAVAFRFESEPGKDFQLIGFAAPFTLGGVV